MHRALVIALFASSWSPVRWRSRRHARAAARLSPAKVVIIVGATHGATAIVPSAAPMRPTPRRSSTRRTSSRSTARTRRGRGSRPPRSGRPSSSTSATATAGRARTPTTPSTRRRTASGSTPTPTVTGGCPTTRTATTASRTSRTLDLAPNAIVMLHHLCYASGNSEPGHAQPTVTVARQRISNYAAGFLRTSAQAVIADGHRGPADYLRRCSRPTRRSSRCGGPRRATTATSASFTSTRTSGVRALMDPEGTSSGFYRSLVTDPLLTTTMVTGIVDTSRHPGTLVDPGAGGRRDAGCAPLPGRRDRGCRDARRRLDAAGRHAAAPCSRARRRPRSAAPRCTRSRASTTQRRSGSCAVPTSCRATAPRRASSPSTRPPRCSRRTTTTWPTPSTLTARLSESADWRIRVRDAEGATLYEATGSGNQPTATWDGLVDGVAVADGTYGYVIEATDPWANAGSRSGSIRVDTTGPTLSAVTPGGRRRCPRSRRTATASARRSRSAGTTSERGSVAVQVRDGSGTLVRSLSAAAGAAGPVAITWDGKGDDGRVVPDGDYDVRLIARTPLGNTGDGVDRTVRVVGLLGYVTSSKIAVPPARPGHARTGDAPVADPGPAGDRDLDDPERERRGRGDAARRRRAAGRRHRPQLLRHGAVGGAAAARALHVVRGRRRRRRGRHAGRVVRDERLRDPALGIERDARPVDHALGRVRRGPVPAAQGLRDAARARRRGA